MKTKKFQFSLIATLIVFGVFVFAPMISAIQFTFRTGINEPPSFSNYRWVFEQSEFLHYIVRSSWLSALSVVITLIILVPLMTWLHVTKSRLRPFFDTLTLLPLIIPVVAYAIGAQVSMPMFMQNSVYELTFIFAMLALPYTYRALDIGLNAIPLSTLVEASRSSGANWPNTILYVLFPAIRTSVLAAMSLCFALSIGEFTITSLLHWDTFPTWISNVSQGNTIGAITLSMIALVIPFLLISIVTAVLPEKNQGNQ